MNEHFQYHLYILRNRTKMCYHLSDHPCLLNLPLSPYSHLQTVRQVSKVTIYFLIKILRCSLYSNSDLILAIHTGVDFQSSIPPLRGYGSSQPPGQHNQPDRRYQEYLSNSPDDNNLDPVSALLRAGEIVENRSTK